MLTQARALQEAGCFAIVLECIPGPIAAAITAALKIPTIGIGAGPSCSGQVLVYHDLLGMMSHPHHAKVTPKFCKQYAQVGRCCCCCCCCVGVLGPGSGPRRCGTTADACAAGLGHTAAPWQAHNAPRVVLDHVALAHVMSPGFLPLHHASCMHHV